MRRTLIHLAAILGSLALALFPSVAHATPVAPSSNTIGGVSPAANVPFDAEDKPGTPATATVNGFPLPIACASADATGVVHAGTPVPDPWMEITGITLVCPTIIPGLDVEVVMDEKCPGDSIKLSDPTIEDPPGFTSIPLDNTYDVGITGPVDFGPEGDGCIRVNFTLDDEVTCTFQLWGEVAYTFDETVKVGPPPSQQLTIEGTLTMDKVEGSECPAGYIYNTNTVDWFIQLNVFTGATPGDLIDFLP